MQCFCIHMRPCVLLVADFNWLINGGAVWSRGGHKIQLGAYVSVSSAPQKDQKTKTHLLPPLGVHPSQQDHQDLSNPEEKVHHLVVHHCLKLCCYFKHCQLFHFHSKNYALFRHWFLIFLVKWQRWCVDVSVRTVCVCLLDTYIHPWKSWQAWFSWYPWYSCFPFGTLYRQRFMKSIVPLAR